MTTLSPAEQKVLAEVRTNGWHVINVMPEESSPGWAFSIGFFETLRQPEILIFGLRDSTMVQLINRVAEDMKDGARYTDGLRDDGLIQGYECRFKAVDPVWYVKTVGLGLWFYGEKEFPLLQLYWPDRNGHFPWDKRCEASVRALQPRLHLSDPEEAGAAWLID
jgi:hypothetical protein